LCSLEDEYSYKKVEDQEAIQNAEHLFYLVKLDVNNSKKTYSVSSVEDFFIKNEDLSVLCKQDVNIEKKFYEMLINTKKIKAVNTSYKNYEECFNIDIKKKHKINVFALGDVGSTLLMGLRLLGENSIEEIGIYDINEMVANRWFYEINQITDPFNYDNYPKVKIVDKNSLFDCDMFVFCASLGIPAVGSVVKDVRMEQFKRNKELVKEYAILAEQKQFKGIFAVVSDPVDPLCRVVCENSNLSPERIKGYGLGVMNARAMFYADMHEKFSQYKKEGRAFGPHGSDLIIADNIENYKDDLSCELTDLVVNANIEVRKFGFKPYVAPAMSSAAISIMYTLEGKWHYSSVYIGGVYFGCKNRLSAYGTEIERINMPAKLYERLLASYQRLKEIK
jgi:malate/lactate dehydrogenase